MKKQEFKWRSFVSFGMFFSFLIMSISGLILYIAPPGRVFRWTDWHFLFIDLDQWQSLHTLFSYFFLGFAISHVFSMNWKILFSYFTRKAKEGLRRRRELIASGLLVLLFVFGTLVKVPPFQSVMDLGNWVSKTWGEKIDYPPVAHAEEMSIAEIADVILDIPIDSYLSRIRESGFSIHDASQTLSEVCQYNDVSPYIFFEKTTKGLTPKSIPTRKHRNGKQIRR